MKKNVKILLVGGGTGGHIFPLLAVAGELDKIARENGLGLKISYFGQKNEFSQILIDSGIRFSSVISSKLNRNVSLANLFMPFKFLAGLFQSLWKVFWLMPDAVFSKGGPGALPILFACKFFFIPIIIHESDSIPGLTSVISGKLAKKIFVGFESTANYFYGRNVTVSGNPVRYDLVSQKSKELEIEDAKADAKRHFGFDANLPVLMILGGSQGATRLNDFILENLRVFLNQFQILHQVGSANYESYKKDYEIFTKDWSPNEKQRYQFHGFFGNDLAKAYVATDLVLARAGAGTIFELAYFGKPSILIPLPEAANNHQLKNAIEYEKNGAAIIIQQENLLGNLVASQLTDLLNNKEALSKMSLAAEAFYRPDSASVIAQEILKFAV
ncbi:MAG: UDP-N-acetylglucosamine--N-acetylmuramyl-(pentapeptide) pyrophosphoryl-undecaprenol N-acetylglucosamine transferase [Candidatus Pacebacteria bacterium]|nr:UDP-N-acetylglucosamine--N-acetylmuramyl-(pentapeptide) pyrophosphoryl-undecaprenol N-acetylglucosamine transferase [Candidatus Paceibacterota bacterium]